MSSSCSKLLKHKCTHIAMNSHATHLSSSSIVWIDAVWLNGAAVQASSQNDRWATYRQMKVRWVNCTFYVWETSNLSKWGQKYNNSSLCTILVKSGTSSISVAWGQNTARLCQRLKPHNKLNPLAPRNVIWMKMWAGRNIMQKRN